MRRFLCVSAWLYERALCLYPRAYRDEYDSEMAWVFERSVEQASRRGWTALLQLVTQELRSLPWAIAREHQRARSKQIMIEGTPPVQEERFLRSGGGSWREVLAALAPFLLLGIVPPLLGMTPLSGRFSTAWG